MKQYAERDLVALDEAGDYYLRHVSAMAEEGLHSKSAIAAELGYRDMEIDSLRAQLAEAQKKADKSVRTLELAGHVDNGGRLWEPPVAKVPCDLIRKAEALDRLSLREKWLMRKAWLQAQEDVDSGESPYLGLDEWLSDMVADAATVEMLLIKDADAYERSKP